MKKILYLYSDAGGCHKIAAEAIAEAIDYKSPGNFEHKIVDIWSLGSKFQEKLFGEGAYKNAMQYYPSLYGLGFWLTNSRPISSFLSRLNYPSLGRGLKELIQSERPDLIVSVHPLVNSPLIQSLRELNLYGVVPTINCELELVTVHHFWVDRGFDYNVVPTKEARDLFLKRGVHPGKIKLIGFPVRKKFLEELPDNTSLRRELGLDENKFSILIMGGAEGVGDIVGIVNELKKARKEIQVLVCTGKNKRLFDQLKSLHVSYSLKVYSFTEKIPQLMRASDLILTKAGAASVSEAIASELPMIIYSYIPGQEAGSPGWVEKNGFGKYVKEPELIVKTINNWVESGKINEIRSNISKFRDPASTFKIADLILSILKTKL